MAHPQKLFRDALVLGAGVTDLIGARAFFLQAPQGTALPYVTLQRVSELRRAVLNGPDVLPQTLLQVDVIAETMPEAGVLADEIRQQMDTYSSNVLPYCRLVNEFESYDAETEFPRIIQEYRVTYAE